MRRLGQGLVGLMLLLLSAQLFLPDQGVGFVTGIVTFLLIWWMVLFMVLPLRVQSQIEIGEIVKGSDPGAPQESHLSAKAWLVTQITSGIWLVYFIAFEFGLVRFAPLTTSS